MKELEEETIRLRNAVSDLTLDKMILAELARETSEPVAPSPLHRALSQNDDGVRMPCLCGARVSNGEIFHSLREAQIVIAGAAIAMRSVRINPLATSRWHKECSCRHWPHDLTRRLRPLPRPHSI